MPRRSRKAREHARPITFRVGSDVDPQKQECCGDRGRGNCKKPAVQDVQVVVRWSKAPILLRYCLEHWGKASALGVFIADFDFYSEKARFTKAVFECNRGRG